MSLKIILTLLLFYFLFKIFDIFTLSAIFCHILTLFLLLPLIYYVTKANHRSMETKAFLKLEAALLAPSIKKRGFFKTLSKASTHNLAETDAAFPSISPFPSRRVEEIIDDLIFEIIKYYVLPYAEANNWRFKNTETFLRKFLKKFASEIVHRMSVIDWNNFFCNSVCEHLRSHINFLKSRNNQNDDNNYFMGSKTEILFTEAVANRLLRSLLDERFIQCEVIYQFCLGLLAHQVFVKTVEYYCNPVNQNQWMFKALIEKKITRSKLNKQMPHFQYDMSFENFFKLVGSINDVNEVKQIKNKLQNEIRMVEVLKFTQLDDDAKKLLKSHGGNKNKGNTKYFKGQHLTKRDLKCYCNQLNTLLETVNTKLKMMGHKPEVINVKLHSSNSSKRLKSSHRSLKADNQTLSKKFKLKVTKKFIKGKSSKNSLEKSSIINECIPYETIMENNEGRKFFKEFLNNTTYSRTVELIEMLIQLQENSSDQHVIGQGIVKRYIHSSPPAFEFDKQLVKEMEEFLKGNTSEKVFEKARLTCDKELKKKWYPYFILSPHYGRFTKYLAKELNSIDQMKLKGICQTALTSESENTDTESEGSAEDLLSINRNEKIISDNDIDEESDALLFNFTESLQANNPNDDLSERNFLMDNQSASETQGTINFEETYVEEYFDEEEDGFLKPKFEDISQNFSGNETLEYYHSKIMKLNKKIDVKVKAYNAGIAVSNKMPLNKKEKSKMKLDLKAVKEDLDELYTKRNKYQYNLTRMDKWILSVGKWNAFVYDIVLPEPKRGTSLDLGFLPTLAESKTGNIATEKEESFLEDDTKEVLIFIMVSLGVTEDQESCGEDNGWLVKHTLKDFQCLKKELSLTSPSIDRVSLPKVPQRLFMRRKYTDNDLSRITKDLDGFIKFVMKDPVLARSENVFKFFCSSVEEGQILDEDSSIGPLSSLANTFSDASAKVKLMAKIPSKLVQKVLAQKKRSGSITSLESDESEYKSDKKSSLRRTSGHINLSGSLKHKFRRMSTSKDFSMSAFELLEELIQLRKSLTLTRRSMITFVQSFFGKNLTQILTENVAWIKAESSIFHTLQTYRDSFRIESSMSTQNSLDLTQKSIECSLTSYNETGKLHPSASAFITVNMVNEEIIDEGAKLHKVNSNSSPTMSKARSLTKSNTGSHEALSSRDNVLEIKPPSDNKVGTISSGSAYDPSWTYNIKCDEAVKRLLWESVPEYLKTLFGQMSVADSVGFVFESMQNIDANKALVYRILQSFVDQLLEEDGDGEKTSSLSNSR